MNQSKCINYVFTKYQDFPGIQHDIRKVVKYIESAFRMFCRKFIKDEILEETDTIDRIIPKEAHHGIN